MGEGDDEYPDLEEEGTWSPEEKSPSLPMEKAEGEPAQLQGEYVGSREATAQVLGGMGFARASERALAALAGVLEEVLGAAGAGARAAGERGVSEEMAVFMSSGAIGQAARRLARSKGITPEV